MLPPEVSLVIRRLEALQALQLLPRRVDIFGHTCHIKYTFDAPFFKIFQENINDYFEIEGEKPFFSQFAGMLETSRPFVPVLSVSVTKGLLAVDDEIQRSFVQKQLKIWRKNVLRDLIIQESKIWLQIMNTKVNAWEFKDLKSTWGMCRMPTRVICLNNRLLHRPWFCIQSVLVHELSHLFHHNHSPAFYAHWGEHFPDYELARTMLRAPVIEFS